jgi:hypothetical protein
MAWKVQNNFPNKVVQLEARIQAAENGTTESRTLRSQNLGIRPVGLMGPNRFIGAFSGFLMSFAWRLLEAGIVFSIAAMPSALDICEGTDPGTFRSVNQDGFDAVKQWTSNSLILCFGSIFGFLQPDRSFQCLNSPVRSFQFGGGSVVRIDFVWRIGSAIDLSTPLSVFHSQNRWEIRHGLSD